MAEETKPTENTNGAAQSQGAVSDPLAALKTELEQEKTRATEAVKLATEPLTAKISSLETSLREREGQVTQLTGNLTKAVDEYKLLIVAGNPLIPADMLQGKSIEELKVSAQKAQAFITSITIAVQTQLDAAAKATVIPAGAPERTENTDNLSAREKINLGLKKVRK